MRSAVAPIPTLVATHTVEMLAILPGGMLTRTTRGHDVPDDQVEFSVWMHEPSDHAWCQMMDSLAAAMGSDEGWEETSLAEFDQGLEIHHFRAWRVPAQRAASG